jgi:5-enolpyruvylshikimate-3-phosphate synthase
MLPDLIEIIPLTGPVKAGITVPGSKSITNRALILAALADGEVTLRGALWSEDTQVMTECLQKLGFEITIAPEPEEFCNRTIKVKGLGGKIPNAGTAEKPLELFVGNAGTAARFLSAFVCLGDGVYRLHGVPRMHERPQSGLFGALGELGYRIEPEVGNDKLPAKIHAEKHYVTGTNTLSRRFCRVDINESSQFASALLMCAEFGNWIIEVRGENADESPYIAMTRELMRIFPKKGGEFAIEPDASSATYFWAADIIIPGSAFWLQKEDPDAFESAVLEFLDDIVESKLKTSDELDRHLKARKKEGKSRMVEIVESSVSVPGFSFPSLKEKQPRMQVDEKFVKYAHYWPCAKYEFSRKDDLGDSIMMAIVLGPFAEQAIKYTDLRKLRLQETERVAALRTELTKCGAKVIEEGDTLTVYPSELHGAEIETYNDHRMAMCFAILGLKVPGIKIKNPACVKKTFPNFFQKLAAAPPHGLGATILDAKTGRKLAESELFAE